MYGIPPVKLKKLNQTSFTYWFVGIAVCIPKYIIL